MQIKFNERRRGLYEIENRGARSLRADATNPLGWAEQKDVYW